MRHSPLSAVREPTLQAPGRSSTRQALRGARGRGIGSLRAKFEIQPVFRPDGARPSASCGLMGPLFAVSACFSPTSRKRSQLLRRAPSPRPAPRAPRIAKSRADRAISPLHRGECGGAAAEGVVRARAARCLRVKTADVLSNPRNCMARSQQLLDLEGHRTLFHEGIQPEKGGSGPRWRPRPTAI